MNTIDVDDLLGYDGPPLYLFIGVSTAGSLVHQAYPEWSELLHPGSTILGVDLPVQASAARFRTLVQSMERNPQVRGAVVTSHKIRLYEAAIDLVDHAEPLVALTQEINSLRTTSGVQAFARDPQSLDLVLDSTGVEMPRPQRPVLCIGAGGSATALLLAMGIDVRAAIAGGQVQPRDGSIARGPLTIVGRRQASLDALASVASRAGLSNFPLELVLADTPSAISEVCRSAVPGSLIANSTGMGKIEAGSPVPGPEAFPSSVVAWDFNYRGPLTFLAQARAAGVTAVDGWDYFVAGWASALAAVCDITLDGALLQQFADRASHLRPSDYQRATLTI